VSVSDPKKRSKPQMAAFDDVDELFMTLLEALRRFLGAESVGFPEALRAA
jgi:hypothetical protein